VEYPHVNNNEAESKEERRLNLTSGDRFHPFIKLITKKERREMV
jgi:hypothetical protein